MDRDGSVGHTSLCLCQNLRWLHVILYVNCVSIKLMSEHNQNRAKHKKAQNQGMIGHVTTGDSALGAEKMAPWAKLQT